MLDFEIGDGVRLSADVFCNEIGQTLRAGALGRVVSVTRRGEPGAYVVEFDGAETGLGMSRCVAMRHGYLELVAAGAVGDDLLTAPLGGRVAARARSGGGGGGGAAMLQLNPPLPVLLSGALVGGGRGWEKGWAHGWLDYGVEAHLMWVCALDRDGSCWTVENPSVRFQRNDTLGRPGPVKPADLMQDRLPLGCAVSSVTLRAWLAEKLNLVVSMQGDGTWGVKTQLAEDKPWKLKLPPLMSNVMLNTFPSERAALECFWDTYHGVGGMVA